MPCCRGQDYDQVFDARQAGRELRTYRKKGATGVTAKLLKAVRRALAGEGDFSHLDIGGGIGVLQHELAADGADRTVAVDASTSYLALLHEAATERGYAERQRCIEGDFTQVAARVEPATVVTLDKVICCYPDVEGLVRSSASKATRFYAITLPKDSLWVRVAVLVGNFFTRTFLRWRFRTFVHSLARVDGLVASEGLRLVHTEAAIVFCVRVYERARVGTPQGT